MPFLFIVAILFVIIALFALLVNRASSDVEVKGAAGFFTIVAGVVAVLALVFASTTIVPTREIGVVTSFGKPTESLSNGFHTKAPWEKVHKLDGKIQTDNFTGKDDAISIRLGNGSTAKVDTTIRWRIKLEAGQDLYRDYRDLDSIRDSLVTRELKAALNEVLGNYDPLVSVKAGVNAEGKTESAGIDLNKFSAEVQEALKSRVGSDVEILSVILPIIRFDGETQEKINAFQAEVGNTRIAEQREATAKAQAQANKNLSASVSNDPNVLVSKCLDALDEMVKKGQNVPIGFSCWPGGAGTSVVLPQK